MNSLICAAAFMVFACIGSFIGVCTERIPRGEQIFKGRSHCDNCQRLLKPWEMVPILSFLALRGKCSVCKSKIPVTGFITETAVAVLGTVCIWLYGFNFRGIVYGVVACVLTEIFLMDLKTMEISDIANLIIAVLGIIMMIKNKTYISSLTGGLCVSIPFLVMAAFGTMGYGDVKFMAAVGILLGLKKTLLAAFIGIVIGSLSAIIIRIKEKKEWKSEIPFGPYLCLGTYISMLFGDKLISFYISLI